MTLPDDFDTAAAKVAGQASGDPIDSAAAQVVQGQRTALRSSLYGALLENPDMAARAQKLGRKTGIPADVVGRNLPEVERNAKLDEFDRVLERSPTVAQWLADQNNAKVAHDDVENLSEHERLFREAVAAGRVAQGRIGETYTRPVGNMREIDRSILQSFTEPVRRGLAQGARGLTLLFNDLGLFDGLQRRRDAARVAAGLAPEGNADLAVLLANQQRDVERFPIPETIARGMNEIGSAPTFGEAFNAAVRNPRAILETTLQSIGSSAPALLTSAGGSVAGPFGTATGAGLGSFAVEYGNTLQEVMAEKGTNPRDPLAISNALANPELMAEAREKAVKRGLPIAAFDALTAGLAGRLLAGAKPTVASVGGRATGELALQAGGGAAGEATAQGATGEFKPGDILLEALAEMPTALVEVPGNFRDAMVRAQSAEQRVQVIEQLNTLAEASKVRERDADTFEQFIAQVSDGAEVLAVYIDANTLAQSGMAEQLAAVSPSVAEQLPAALATGGEVRIPVSEYTARIAGTEFAQGLLDDLRVEGEQFTRREAQEYMQNRAGELEQEFNRVLAEKQADDTFKASADAVKADVKTQLGQAGRFTESVNDAYASLVGNWFAVKAADLGMTPQELFAKYPLRVAAEGVQGQVLEQVTPEQAMQTNVPVEMPEAPEFAEAVTNTPGAQVTENGLLIDLVRFQKPEQEGAQAIRTGVFYLPAKSPNVKHYKTTPSTKTPNTYGGSEKMEGQTLLRRPIFVKGATGGKAPEVAYDAIKGKGAMKVLDKAVMDVVTSRGFMTKIDPESFLMRVEQFLGDFGGDRGMAYEIIENSKQGNTLRYALQEHIIAHVVRNAGYDSVVGYSKGKAGATISEVFDVREQTFPARGMESEIHDAFNQSAQSLPPTIEIDGKQRPTTNSKGLSIASTEEGVRNFWKWFGDSKVVDAEGRPLVVYHGSEKAGFNTFDMSRSGENTGREFQGAYFTSDKTAARTYSGTRNTADVLNDEQMGSEDFDPGYDYKPGNYEVYLRIADPLEVDFGGQNWDANIEDDGDEYYGMDDVVNVAGNADHDGVIAKNVNDEGRHGQGYGTDGNTYVAFTPEQIKSATGNSGEFDPANPNILMQRQAQGNRGSFSPSTNTITLLKGADLSTFLHESGHFFLETQFDIASRLEAQRNPRVSKTRVEVVKRKGTDSIDVEASLGKLPAVQEGFTRLFRAESPTTKFSDVFDASALTGERAPHLPGKRYTPDIKYADYYRSSYGRDAAIHYIDVPNSVAEAGKVSEYEFKIDIDRPIQMPLAAGEQRVLDDTYALLKWFGVEDLTAWHALDFEQKRPLHEKFARGFEAYLFEGRAPSLELQGLFQRFRAWLVNVYKDLKALNVELTDEVRGVMDRMLATSEQIKLAEQGRSMMPLFTSPEQAGMTPEEFAAYQALGVDATNEAIQDVQARTLRDMQWLRNSRGREVKRLQKQAAELRRQVTIDVRREVMSQPVYQAWQFLTAKEGEAVVPGVTDVAAIDPTGARGKLRTDALKALGAPDEVVARVMGLKMTSPEGMHPDIVAEMFGFTSGDELVRTLAAADKPADAIEGLVDARMLEQYGEIATPEAIERAADQAIHNEARARFVATEANALAKATGRPKILASAARDFARATVSRLKVRNLRPGQYATAEVRAAKASAKASQSGDLATAAAEKRNQLVQNYLSKSAYEAQDEVERGVRYLKKFDSDGFRKTVDADYADQIDALLERFDLRKSTTGKEIDRRKSLLAWVESQREPGFEPDIPEGLLDEARRQSYKDMTVEEFRGLLETVKQIEHLGRLKNRLLTAADNKTFDAVKAEIVGGIEANSRGRVADTRTPTTNLGRAREYFKQLGAEHIKVATWARIMDGGKDGGPVWEYLVRSANERGNMETTMRADATVRLAEILAPVFKLGRMGGSGSFFATINRSLNREARLAIALNTGNQGNLQRLLGGEGWTVDQIRPVLQSLTAAEWRAVQAVWDHFESYRPQIGAKERRVYGKEPTWVDPVPFTITTADGQTVELKGGYYPIKYDPAASQRAEEHADAEGAKRQLQGAYTSATTRRSFTKTRTEEVSGRPLLYTLAGLYSGVNDVIHDLAWHEWLIDANRIMRSKTIDAAIRNTYGPAVKAQFKTWINDIAEGDRGVHTPAEMALGRLRQGVSAAGLGFNVTSAAMQITGFNQSIVRVGAKWIAKGVGQFVASPAAKVREVVGKSEFMADRSRTQFRELNELRNRVQDESATMRTIKLGTYFLMMRMQRVVDVPTWLGAYEKAMAEGNAEDRAIALADQAVIDSQGSGMTKDLAGVERGGPVLKLFTVYYSYMNTALNMGVAQTMTAKSKAKLAADMLMLYTVPAVLGSMLKDALTPGGDDDDDMEALARKLAAEQLSYLMGLFVVAREFGEVSKIVTGAEGVRRDYSGPAGLRAISDAVTFAKQAQQGEFDTAFRKASINLVGDLTGLPSAQVNRTLNGIAALEEGDTDNPAAVLFGYQK